MSPAYWRATPSSADSEKSSVASFLPPAALIGSRVSGPAPHQALTGADTWLAGWPVLAQLCDGGMVSYLTIGESDRNMGAPVVLGSGTFPSRGPHGCCFRHLYAGMYVIDPGHVKKTLAKKFSRWPQYQRGSKRKSHWYPLGPSETRPRMMP